MSSSQREPAVRGQVVIFVDTSILDEILDVPGWANKSAQVQGKFGQLVDTGVKFVVPITAIIECGNHIANCAGVRRKAATRFDTLLRQLIDEEFPWRRNALSWSTAVLSDIRQGAGTGTPLIDLLTNQTLGSGDVSIVAEANDLLSRTHGLRAGLWTMDRKFAAHWPHHPAMLER